MAVLAIDDLTVRIDTPAGPITAANGVTLSVGAGEVLAIVGETGSGKTVTAMSVLRLNPSPPAQYVKGRVLFEGRDLLKLSDRELEQIRGNDIGMVFQDPMNYMNPVFTIGNHLTEAVLTHRSIRRQAARNLACETLEAVGISDAAARMDRYPHEFSGGMLQRVMIAMALICRPKVLIADEPTTALDVTVSAGILDLLLDLRDEYDLAVVLITHDLAVVANVADHVAVMYAGRVVESGPTADVFSAPAMPYTAGLLRSRPSLETPRRAEIETIEGRPPDSLRLPAGCEFQPRCPFAQEVCSTTRPPLIERRSGHSAACVLESIPVPSSRTTTPIARVSK